MEFPEKTLIACEVHVSEIPKFMCTTSNKKRDRLGDFTEKQKMHKMSRQNCIRSSNLKPKTGQR